MRLSIVGNAFSVYIMSLVEFLALIAREIFKKYLLGYPFNLPYHSSKHPRNINHFPSLLPCICFELGQMMEKLFLEDWEVRWV